MSSGCTGRMDSCRGYVELVALCGDYLNEPPLISKLFPVTWYLSFPSYESLLLLVCLLPAVETSTVPAYPRLLSAILLYASKYVYQTYRSMLERWLAEGMQVLLIQPTWN